MKNYFLIFSILLFTACNKGKLQDTNNINTGPMDFELIGIHDVVLHKHDSTSINVQLNYLSGYKELVGLSVNNLVPKFMLSFMPQLDTPSFFSTLKIITQDADTGIHSFQILATGSKKVKAYNINVTVIPDSLNPALAFVGNFLETGVCTNNSPNNNLVTAYIPAGSFAKIHLSGLWLGGISYQVDATIDANNHTITIPSQVTNNLTFAGTGTYSGTTIQLAYTITGQLVNENCNVTLVKQ